MVMNTPLAFERIEGPIHNSSLVGTIDVTMDKLINTFGEPDSSIDDKVNYEWTVEFSNGIKAAIYDYKGRQWSVGSNHKIAWDLVMEAILSNNE